MSLASYDAVFFEGRYHYELFADSVHVVGKAFLQGDVDITMPLGNLQPRVDRLWVRSRAFFGGLWFCVAGIVGYSILIEGLKLPWSGLPAILAMCLLVAGLGLCLATLRKTHFAQFVGDSGTPLLLIARTRGRDAEFERFVEALLQQIRQCKTKPA